MKLQILRFISKMATRKSVQNYQERIRLKSSNYHCLKRQVCQADGQAYSLVRPVPVWLQPVLIREHVGVHVWPEPGRFDLRLLARSQGLFDCNLRLCGSPVGKCTRFKSNLHYLNVCFYWRTDTVITGIFI